MENPLVSIIIPAYNRAHLIGETLDSVLAQTYPHWECIIVDDGSTDNNDEVVGTYVAKDPRFKYYHRPPEHLPGGNGARNYGFKVSRGEFVIFLDSDDLLAANCLVNRISRLKNKKADMCVNASGLFNKKIGDNNLIWNEILPKENNEQLLMRFFHTDMPWSTPGVLWRRDFFVHIGGWDERLIAWQDWDLHVRALFKKPEIAQCNEMDNYVRISKRNSIGEKIRTKKYYDSLSKILNNVYQLIKLEKHREDKFSKIFEILKIQKLIFLPMDRGLLKIPPQFFLKLCFFGLQFRFTFLWVYLVQLGSKSSKIKKYILKDILKVQRAKYSSHSTHLKILNKQYDQYHRTVL